MDYGFRIIGVVMDGGGEVKTNRMIKGMDAKAGQAGDRSQKSG